MTKKVYRTARGKTVDLGALQIQNEETRAVGNMKVNARGDRIDADGNVVESVSDRAKKNLDGQVDKKNG